MGNTDLLLDKNLIRRITDIQRLNTRDQNHLFALLDAFIAKTKLYNIKPYNILLSR